MYYCCPLPLVAKKVAEYEQFYLILLHKTLLQPGILVLGFLPSQRGSDKRPGGAKADRFRQAGANSARGGLRETRVRKRAI